MTSGTDDAEQFRALVLDTDDPVDDARLRELRADARVEFIDNGPQLQAELQRLAPSPPPDVIAEPIRWAYYPWRRKAVRVVGPRAFRLLRLDRNRNLITSGELDQLGQLRIGVVGLSVGHAIAYTVAAQGLCGELRLADFDHLELSNLNRVPATVFDLGVNKAVVCARRIAELDPYLPVTVVSTGITAATVDKFLDGLDILIEECDSLDAKVLVREGARARRLPVLMTTSDRGLLDVERFDLEPSRPQLHGLLGDIDSSQLTDLRKKDKLAHALRMVDASRVSARMAASLIEVGNTLSTWPQLASEVALNSAVVAEAVRRIGLREKLHSGKVRIDVAAMLDQLDEPLTETPDHRSLDDQPEPLNRPGSPRLLTLPRSAHHPVATRNPGISKCMMIRCAFGWPRSTRRRWTSGYRASAVALGAATFNARVAAAAHGAVATVDFQQGNEGSPLGAVVQLSSGDDPELAAMYVAMLRRETNRRLGNRAPIPAQTLDLLASTAQTEGARLQVLSTSAELEAAAAILAPADRIRFLTPRLHSDMFSELRAPGDPSPDSGIDVRSLELDPADLVMLDILRRPEVMANPAAWGGGSALGDAIRERVTASAALAVISVRGHSLTDYARGGAATEAVWIKAEQLGLAVQPISPAFLYAHGDEDLRELSPAFAEQLGDLQYNFHKLAGTEPAESHALVLRFCHAPRASVPSRRRGQYRISSPRG